MIICPATIRGDPLQGVLARAISSLVLCGKEEALVNARVLGFARAKTLPDLETASETFNPRQCAGAGNSDESTSQEAGSQLIMVFSFLTHTSYFVSPVFAYWGPFTSVYT